MLMTKAIENTGFDKKNIKEVANILTDELAESLYYKLTLVKFLPEIKAIKRGKLKALKGKDIYDFLNK